MVHQPDKRQVVLRFNQQDVFNMAKDAVDRLADVRIEVDRIDNLYIDVLRRNFSQRVTDLLKTPAKAFATMACDQNGFFAVIQEWIAGCERFLQIAVCGTRSRTQINASMTVLPVTKILLSAIFSRSRF